MNVPVKMLGGLRLYETKTETFQVKFIMIFNIMIFIRYHEIVLKNYIIREKNVILEAKIEAQ